MGEFWRQYKWWLVGVVVILAVAAALVVFATNYGDKEAVPPLTATPTYNVLDYGVKNDGTGIQDAAILKAVSAARGGIVYFPGGNYSVSKSFKLPYGTVTKGDSGTAKQSYLMVIMPQPDGTVTWKFTWIKP